jgi:hypothetical protein
MLAAAAAAHNFFSIGGAPRRHVTFEHTAMNRDDEKASREGNNDDSSIDSSISSKGSFNKKDGGITASSDEDGILDVWDGIPTDRGRKSNRCGSNGKPLVLSSGSEDSSSAMTTSSEGTSPVSIPRTGRANDVRAKLMFGKGK